jgi:hypothetical protein
LKHQIAIFAACISSLVLLLTPLLVSPARSQEESTVDPDTCEANNTWETACELPLNTVSQVMTFHTADDADYYRVNLGKTPGLVPIVKVWGNQAITLVASVYRASDRFLLDTIESSQPREFSTGLVGEVIIQVENRSIDEVPAGGYRLEVRRVQPTPTPTFTPFPTWTPFPTHTPEPTGTPKPTETRVPRDHQLDDCEENDTWEDACDLAMNGVSAPMTFLPEGDTDIYRINLDLASGPVEITLRSAGVLEPVATIYDLNPWTVLGEINPPDTSTVINGTGYAYLYVQDRSLDEPEGNSYRVEVRQVTGEDNSGSDGSDGSDSSDGSNATPHNELPYDAQPDALENNWSPETAATVALNHLYDLNFICPVPGGCEGGDHDYLMVDVKMGIPYVMGTFDLAPGVDTVMNLFWPYEGALVEVGGNDDYAPGGLLSYMEWTPPADGTLYVRIGPRQGAAMPVMGVVPGYRFLIAPRDSGDGQSLQDIVAQQSSADETPIPTEDTDDEDEEDEEDEEDNPPDVGNPPAPPPPPQPQQQQPSAQPTIVPMQIPAPIGTARVVTDTGYFVAPGGNAADLVDTLPEGTIVSLNGLSRGIWVFVTSYDNVVTGWVDARKLRLIEGALAGTPIAAPLPTDPTSVVTGTSGAPIPTPIPGETPTPTPVIPNVNIAPPESLPLPPEPTAASLQPLTVRALVVRVPRTVSLEPGQPTPTPAPDLVSGGVPIAGMRVQLVNVFGDVLVESVTSEEGDVVLTRAVMPGTAVYVQIPAVGIRARVPPDEMDMVIALPGGM